MPVICETLPLPREKPISESDSEDDESGESGEGSGNESDVDLKLCQGLVGMECMPPDLAYTIHQLSQFNSNPKNAHFQVAKRVI